MPSYPPDFNANFPVSLLCATIQGKLEPSPQGGPEFRVSPSKDVAVPKAQYAWAPPTEFSSSMPVDATGLEASEGRATKDPALTSGDVTSGGVVDDEARMASATVAGGEPSVVVVGAGPAGLFAALELVEAGIKPTIVERGM